ncbi:MAG: peptidyl-prolyl cis-trans isomerase [Planctomycetes bacterium]|nr:peptidyl-prolyl cis-trans isomerase [Planctomycetota bacterium]
MRNAFRFLIAATTLAPCVTGFVTAAFAQDRRAGELFSPPTASQSDSDQPAAPPKTQVLSQLDGAQVIARIDGQIVLACDVLWRVNVLIEANKSQHPEFAPEQWDQLRRELMKREVAALVDRKLLYAEFRRKLPEDAWPQIEENLLKPFDEMEMPQLVKQLKVESPAEVEPKLTQLGSSLPDARRSFNERAIASELLRSKVKINEEVGPDEMLTYYQAHLADYEYPTQARWEELMVRKNRFSDPRQAFAELATMGNEVWQRAATRPNVQGAVFAEVAKAKSDGFTAKEGGLHDWTSKGSLKSQAIDNGLFTLAIGQMSQVLESETGFHIVRVLERKEAGRRPFTEVQGEIREELKKERFQKGAEEYIARLRQDARIWTTFTGPTTAHELLGLNPGPQRR